MPQQQQGIQLGAGPFQAELTRLVPPPQPAHQFTGHESGLGVAAGLLTHVIGGLQQDRRQKLLQQEASREKQNMALMNSYQAVQNDPDMSADARRAMTMQILGFANRRALQEMGGSGEGKKHPLRGIMEAFSGGPVPNKADPEEFGNFLADWQTRFSQAPRYNEAEAMKRFVSAVDTVKAEATKTGAPVYQQDLLRHPAVNEALQYMQQFNRDPYKMPQVQSVLSGFEPREAGVIGKYRQDTAQAAYGSQPPVPPSQPGVQSLTQPWQANQVPTAPVPSGVTAPYERKFSQGAQPPTPPGAAPGTDDARMRYSMMNAKPYGAPDTLRDASGRIFRGQYYDMPSPSDPARTERVLVDLGTNSPVGGPVTEATTAMLNRPTEQELGTVREEVKSLVESYGLSPEDAVYKRAMSAAEARIASGDPRGASTAATSILRANESLLARKQAADAAKTAKAAANNALTTNQQATFMNRYQSAMGTNPTIKSFSAVNTHLQNIEAAYEDLKSGTNAPGMSDFTLIRGYAKITDELTGVREGEYNTVEEALGALKRAGVKITKGWWDGTKLSPEARDSILRLSKQIVERKAKLAKKVVGSFVDEASKYGVDAKSLYVTAGLSDFMGGDAPPTPPGGSMSGQADKAKSKLLNKAGGW